MPIKADITTPYITKEDIQAQEAAAAAGVIGTKVVKEYDVTTVKSSGADKPKTITGAGTKDTPLKATTISQPDREVSAENQSLIDALKNLGITRSISNIFTTPLTITAAAQDDSQQGLYKITTTDGHVNVVQAKDVYEAADKYGTYIGDPDTSIRRLDIGCYPPTYAEAKKQYERDPLPLGSYTPKVTPSITPPAATADISEPYFKETEIEPVPILPTLITKYRFTLNDGTVKEFEAMTTAEAEANVNKYNADLETLSIAGHRPLSQYEIEQALRGAASRSDMDYARALIKYGQVEGVVPVRDGGTGEAMLIAESDWLAMPKEYQDIVIEDGLEALNKTIYNELPEKYQLIADERDLAAALVVYNGDVERANEVLDKLKPYKDGDNYDIVTPLETGVVTGDDLRAAGFDTKDIKDVIVYVNKLSNLVDKWDKEAKAGTFITSAALSQGELNDFTNATIEAGIFKKYKIGDAGTEMFGMAPAALANKWDKDISLEDKYNVAEIYAGYPAPARLLSSTYRGMVAQAPEMNAVARFTKEFALGGAAATLQPFVKEQYKDNLQVMLKNYKEDGGYNITEYLKDYPEDASILARGGIEIKELEKALDGQRVITQLKGATPKEWAVAGLIVVAVGAGGGSLATTGVTKAGLVATSGLATLGLGTYATIDTVKYWPQMDNTQRAIAIAFDVLLITSGAIAARGGLRSFKQQGGFTQIRNKIMYNYRAARNVIKKILPGGTKADTILRNLQRAIETGDTKLLKATARQLELEAAKLPKEIGDPLVKRARLLQAAPDDYVKIKDTPPDDLNTAIDTLSADIKAMESALSRVKDPKRYNTIKQALEKTILDREALLKTRVATKQKTTVPLQEPVEAGKYLPSTGKTKAVTTKTKPDVITAGAKARPIPVEDLRRLTPNKVAQKHFVSIYDISRALRQLPDGVQDELSSASPSWAIVVNAQTATKTELDRRLKEIQKQKIQPVPQPAPIPATETKPQLATETKPETKKKLKEKEALAIYPFFEIPQDVKTRHKRKRTRDIGEGEIDISARLPRDRNGIITRKQGLFYITIFPPYRKQDRIFTRKKPYYAESGKGKGSPQRTLKTVGGKAPKLVRMPLGIVTTNIKDGKVLTFDRRPVSRRRHKGRRRGRIVY